MKDIQSIVNASETDLEPTSKHSISTSDLTPVHGSPAWIKERATYIGGTDISAIIGVNPYSSPWEVYCRKLGLLPQEPMNQAMKRGVKFEAPLCGWFAEETGLKLQPAPQIVCRHPKYDFIGGNPDRLVGTDAVLEVKTVGVNAAREWGPAPDGPIPQHYLVQLHWYLGLTNRPIGYFAAYIEGREGIQIYRIDHDPELFEFLIAAAVRFWTNHIVPQVAPEVDGSDSCSEILSKIYPADTGEVIDGDDDVAMMAARLQDIKAQSSKLYKQQIEIENYIKSAMGEASVMNVEGYSKPFTWKKAKDSVSTDWEAMARNLIEAEKLDESLPYFTVTKPGSRRFLTPFSRETK